MSSDKKWSFRLQHILHAIEKIQRYTEEHTEESFGSDEKTIDAVIRNFQVIGEAARLIPDNVQSAHPDIPWSDMQKMRHVLVHDYDKVDAAMVWRTVQQDLPPLVEPLKRLLAETKK
jgi:uncharacterized protein with HEPN domain